MNDSNNNKYCHIKIKYEDKESKYFIWDNMQQIWFHKSDS